MHITAHRRPLARTLPAWPMLMLIGAVWLAGCASTAQKVSVQGAWQDKASHDQSFSRILVLAVTPEINQRCNFEHFLVAQIGNDKAIASCDAMSLQDLLTRENVERAVASSHADAVLATSLVSMSMGAKEGGDTETRGEGYYKATGTGYEMGYYGVYGVPVVYGDFRTAPSVMELKGEARIVSRLYETRGATLVYTIDTKAKNLESQQDLGRVTAPIADRLREAGLVR